MAKGRKSGCYRDDESGSIPSLGMTHHTQAQSRDRGSADTLFSGTGKKIVRIDCTCRSRCIVRAKEQRRERVKQLVMNTKRSGWFQGFYGETVCLGDLIQSRGRVRVAGSVNVSAVQACSLPTSQASVSLYWIFPDVVYCICCL